MWSKAELDLMPNLVMAYQRQWSCYKSSSQYSPRIVRKRCFQGGDQDANRINAVIKRSYSRLNNSMQRTALPAAADPEC